MSDAASPTLHVIAGPNGSGKSTLTSGLLSRVRVPIIDPDAIAQSLRPIASEAVAMEAGREALRQQQHYLRHRTGFAVETTLAGTVTLRLMEQARSSGFVVHLIYICLDSEETNIGRVGQRVTRGGHHVPDEDVRRRYARSLQNLLPALQLAETATIFDNTSDQGPRLVLTIASGRITMRVIDLPTWLIGALGVFLADRP